MKRRNRHPRRDSRTGFSIFIIVIILAIAAGYAGTKYIIFPYLLGNDKAAESGKQSGVDETATGSGVDVLPDTPSVIIDQQNLTNDAGDKGNTDANKENTDPNKGNTVVNNGVAATGVGPFCVQFGSFSTKEGADALSNGLTGKGIYSYVYESGGNYKVLGLPYPNKDKAKEAAAIVSAAVSDAFVVDLSTLIQ